MNAQLSSMSGAALIEVSLKAVTDVARDTRVFELAPLHGSPLPAAEAGAHIDIHLPNGMTRQYSLLNPGVAPSAYSVGIKLDPNSRGGSRYFFDALKVGERLTISAPRNHFALTQDVRPVVLFAGGIGITPIWAMIQELRERTPAATWELHYSCRSRADMPFIDALIGNDSVHCHFDDENAGKFLNLADIIAKVPPDAHLYCCGPVPMLDAFHAAAKTFPADRVHSEYFAAKDAPNLDGGFIVELARTKKEFVIPPGKSILQALRDGGLDLDSSCEEGICGVCEKNVISGIPDHRDVILSDAEHASNKTMMICCSGSKSARLVLDM